MSNRRALFKERPLRRHAGEAKLTDAAAGAEPASHTPTRWTCRHHAEGSDITGYVLASDSLEVIAQTRQADGIDARANAELIVRAVNNHEKYRPVIHDLITALDLCLKSNALTWEAEQEADVALAKARGVVGG